MIYSMLIAGRDPSLSLAYSPTHLTGDHSPGRICARARLAVASSSMNRNEKN